MAKPRILIVDDNQSLLVTLAALLEEHFDVTTVDTGTKGLEALAAEDFVVVCSDYRLPDISGLDVLKAVLERPIATAGLLMTVERDVEERPPWMEGKTVAVVFKPFQPQQLVQNLTQLAQLVQVRRNMKGAGR